MDVCYFLNTTSINNILSSYYNMTNIYSYILFDLLLWCIAFPLLWYPALYSAKYTPLNIMYLGTLTLITIWHIGLLWHRYVLQQLQPFLLSLWLEAVGVCMGVIILLFAIETFYAGRCMMACVPFCVGIAIIIAHGQRFIHPDIKCYYWCT